MRRRSDPISAYRGCLVLISVLALCALPAIASGDGVRAVPEVFVYADAQGNDSIDDGDGPRVVVVDKSRQQINLYGFDGYWRNLIQWPCSTGKIGGAKHAEGDQKTPEGIYFAVRNVGKRYLSPIYGARALPLDYPNWLDRRQAKSGSAIWLHGTNKPLKARDSNGCVVLQDADIDQLAQHIRLQQTPVIIVDRVRLRSQKRSRQAAGKILSAMDHWHRALMYGDYFSFSHWYAGRHKPSMGWWQQWCRQRRKGGQDQAYGSALARRVIFRIDKVYVILFDHLLTHGDRQTWAGRRKLYLEMQDDDVRIIRDTYQPRPQGGRDPLLLAWKKLYPHGYEPGQLASGKSGRKGS